MASPITKEKKHMQDCIPQKILLLKNTIPRQHVTFGKEN
jgi:hypothetical protein